MDSHAYAIGWRAFHGIAILFEPDHPKTLVGRRPMAAARQAAVGGHDERFGHAIDGTAERLKSRGVESVVIGQEKLHRRRRFDPFSQKAREWYSQGQRPCIPSLAPL